VRSDSSAVRKIREEQEGRKEERTYGEMMTCVYDWWGSWSISTCIEHEKQINTTSELVLGERPLPEPVSAIRQSGPFNTIMQQEREVVNMRSFYQVESRVNFKAILL